MALAPSFISSLSRVASHPATDPVNGVGGLQLEASKRRARWGPGGPAPDLRAAHHAHAHHWRLWLQQSGPAARQAPSRRVQGRLGGSAAGAFELRAAWVKRKASLVRGFQKAPGNHRRLNGVTRLGKSQTVSPLAPACLRRNYRQLRCPPSLSLHP